MTYGINMTLVSRRKVISIITVSFIIVWLIAHYSLKKEVADSSTVLEKGEINMMETVYYSPQIVELSPKFFADQEKRVKTILYWNHYFNIRHFGLGIGRAPLKTMGCVVTNCEFWDRVDGIPDLPHHVYDAVLFHGIDTENSSVLDLPLTRSPHQRYVFFLFESPALRPHIYNMDNFFNWTITHRRDSDITYGLVFQETGDAAHKGGSPWLEPTLDDIGHLPETLAQKPELVAWFTSNNNTHSERYKYVNELAKYVPVHVYGEGQPLQCPRTINCDQMMGKKYKFYLSFENSLCVDYLTEKFSRPMYYHTVPIVYGGADYTAVAPPLSYIDVKDFVSPRQLGRYLLYLHRHPREYLKYFWWTKYYRVFTPHWACELCAKLNRPDEPRKSYPSIERWWFSENICHSPEEHFRKHF